MSNENDWLFNESLLIAEILRRDDFISEASNRLANWRNEISSLEARLKLIGGSEAINRLANLRDLAPRNLA